MSGYNAQYLAACFSDTYIHDLFPFYDPDEGQIVSFLDESVDLLIRGMYDDEAYGNTMTFVQPVEGRTAEKVESLNFLLHMLEDKITMTEKLIDATYIDEGMRMIFEDDPMPHFPDFVRARAKALYESWEGRDIITDEHRELVDQWRLVVLNNEAMDEMTSVPEPKDETPDPETDPSDIRVRNANVHGHNELKVGSWWRSSNEATQAGALGNAQMGAWGNKLDGTFAIQVTDSYNAENDDQGDKLYFAAPGSKDAWHPTEAPIPRMSQRLHRSYDRYQNGDDVPVRVLRSFKSNSNLRPRQGIRYDGLYDIVNKEKVANGREGLFWRFKLERRDGQEDLAQVKERVDAELKAREEEKRREREAAKEAKKAARAEEKAAVKRTPSKKTKFKEEF